jgi:O-antigen/teichoic acid export membrane protein
MSNITSAALAFLVSIGLGRIWGADILGNVTAVYSALLISASVIEFGAGNTFVVLCGKYKYIEWSLFLNLFKHMVRISIIVLPLLYFLYLKSLVMPVWIKFSVLFGALSYSLYRLTLAMFQAKGRWFRYSSSNMMVNFLRLIAIFIVFFFPTLSKIGKIPESIILWFVICILISTLINFISVKKTYEIKSEVSKKFSLFSDYLIYYGFSNTLIIVMTRADSILLSTNINSYEAGIFSAANNLAMLFPLLTTAFLTVFIQQISKNKSLTIEKLVKNQLRVFPFVVVAILFCKFASGFIVEFVYGKGFEKSAFYFFMLASIYILGTFFTPLESYLIVNNKKSVLHMKFMQFITYFLVFFIFVHAIGPMAMILSILFARIVGWVFLSISLFRINYHIKKPIVNLNN